MKILSMDCSATAGSVAVVEDEKLISSFYINTKLTHSQTLMVMTENLLSASQVSLEEIDLFAISRGPGSFTGIRIGIAAIKGMAMALKKPCIGISTLEAMAYNASVCEGIVCCVMDARCNQVYNAFFEVANGEIVRITQDNALTIEEVICRIKEYKKDIYIVGDGTKVLCSAIAEMTDNIAVKNMPAPLDMQNAVGVARAAMQKGAKEHIVASELVPEYLRLPQAERELKKRLNSDGGK